jgi:hypothetical protein
MGGIKMSVNLESIDMLRERTGATYEEAKEALENCNEDMVEALVYLERNKKIKAEPKAKCNRGRALIGWIKSVISKGNRTKLDVTKNEKSVVRIPLTILALIIVFAPHLSVIALIVALFTEHRFQVIKETGESVALQKMFD